MVLAMDLPTTATNLYSLLPGEFTAARNAKAKEASQSGDKQLGKQIRALPKPSTAAWLVNTLVRERSEPIDDVLQLGASLRQAQHDLDQQQLRELGRQRHELLSALVDQARSLAGELDQRVSDSVADDVEQTLHAAMADADAANAVASGLLTRALSSTGWEPVDLEGAVAVPEAAEQEPTFNAQRSGKAKQSTRSGNRKAPPKDKAVRKKAGEKEDVESAATEQDGGQGKSGGQSGRDTEQTKRSDQRLKEAKTRLEEAEQRVQEAESRQHAAEEQLEEAESKQERLAAELDKLKNRLRKLESEQQDADDEVERMESEHDDAIDAVKDARREARRARRKVNELP